MPELKVVEAEHPSALQRLVDDYLMNRRARGASRKTIANLDLALRRVFLPWCASKGITDVGRLTSRHWTASRLSFWKKAAPAAS